MSTIGNGPYTCEDYDAGQLKGGLPDWRLSKNGESTGIYMKGSEDDVKAFLDEINGGAPAPRGEARESGIDRGFGSAEHVAQLAGSGIGFGSLEGDLAEADQLKVGVSAHPIPEGAPLRPAQLDGKRLPGFEGLGRD